MHLRCGQNFCGFYIWVHKSTRSFKIKIDKYHCGNFFDEFLIEEREREIRFNFFVSTLLRQNIMTTKWKTAHLCILHTEDWTFSVWTKIVNMDSHASALWVLRTHFAFSWRYSIILNLQQIGKKNAIYIFF